jgi:hypothetical protein
VRSAQVDWILAKMTDLGEAPDAFTFGAASIRLGPSQSGERGVPGRVSRGVRHTLVRPSTAQPGTLKNITDEPDGVRCSGAMMPRS